MFRSLVALWVLVFCTAVPVAAAETSARLSTETRVQLQSAMRMYIDKVTVAGNYPNLDFKSGKVRNLHPAAAHPMILRMGEFYVLCVDFRDDAGASVNVDFYLSKKDKGYAIFQVEVANRAPLEALVKSGTAAMLE